MDKVFLECPNCLAKQGEVDGKIHFKRKGGGVSFEPKGRFEIECHACGAVSEFEMNTSGKLQMVNCVVPQRYESKNNRRAEIGRRLETRGF